MFVAFLAALSLAGERELSLPPSGFRVVRVPDIGAELTPGGQAIPGANATAFLTFDAANLGVAEWTGFGELRAPLSADSARAGARVVASTEPISGMAVEQTEDVYVPRWDGTTENCDHYQFRVLKLAISAGAEAEKLHLAARIEVESARSTEPKACPRPTIPP